VVYGNYFSVLFNKTLKLFQNNVISHVTTA